MGAGSTGGFREKVTMESNSGSAGGCGANKVIVSVSWGDFRQQKFILSQRDLFWRPEVQNPGVSRGYTPLKDPGENL